MILTLMESSSAAVFHFGRSSKIPGITLRRKQEDFSHKGAETPSLLQTITILLRERRA
jgi:hypothetical protein